MFTTCPAPFRPHKTTAVHSQPRTTIGRPGLLKTPGRERCKRLALLERPGASPSSFSLSGFSSTLPSHTHNGSSPAASNSLSLCSACCHKNRSISPLHHLAECNKRLNCLVPAGPCCGSVRYSPNTDNTKLVLATMMAIMSARTFRLSDNPRKHPRLLTTVAQNAAPAAPPAQTSADPLVRVSCLWHTRPFVP